LGRQLMASSESGEKEEKAPEPLDVTSLDVYQLLELFIGILSEQTWQYIGLRVRSSSQKVEKDMPRAKVAIDCISYMIERLEPQTSDAEKNRLRALLADLQINFVRQQQ
jgi:hypothetical protein